MTQETMKILLNLRSLRVACRDYDLEELKDALNKLTQVVEERIQEEEKLQAENREKEEKLAAYRDMMLSDGIDIDELLQSLASTPKKSKRTPRPAKYKYVDETGKEKTWTGQGRTPKFLVGKDLNDFLI
ncbi:H-NS family histone-like protein [Photobacterium leiognathi]|uniref:H-NS family histone-like protein n=1 Tax=Photobacterium leiognathi TaxID=553611 RepID=UPI0027383314|nr:H-NS family nucleoid-associated regulatory protein [Photobacterium leiognathi]